MSELRQTHDWNYVNWENFATKTNGTKYNWESKSKKLTQRLVDDITLRKPMLLPSKQVISDQEETYESLQQCSQLIMQPARGGYCVTMPLLTFCGLVSVAATAVDSVATTPKACDRFEKLRLLLDTSLNDWKGFKTFASTYVSLLNDFQAHNRNNPFGFYGFPLEQRCGKGYGGGGAVRMVFDGNQHKNAPDAPFDAFYLGDHEGPPCSPGASHVLVVEQYKPYADMGLTYEQCRDEHQKNKEAWDEAKNIEGKVDYRLVTIVITNCHVSGVPEDSDKDADLLVVASTKFTELYGVLTPLLTTDRLQNLDVDDSPQG